MKNIPVEIKAIEKALTEGVLDVATLAQAYANQATVIRELAEKIVHIQHPEAENRFNLIRADLEAISWKTNEATHQILYCAEQIEEKVTQISTAETAENHSLKQELESAVQKLFESCGFQDLIGQRLTLVINMLDQMKNGTQAVFETLGMQAFADIPIPDKNLRNDDDILLLGPDLSGDQGINQQSIDLLFD